VTVRPRSPFQEKYLKADARVMVVGGAAGCLPADAEYLSESGWRSISDYNGGKVGVVRLSESDKDFAELSFEKPKGFVNLSCEAMRHIRSTRFGMKLSDEHKVVYWNDNTQGYRVLPYSEVLQQHDKSKTKGWTGKIKTSFSKVSGRNGIPLSEGYLRLQVAIMADGCFVPEGANNCCAVYLSKEQKKERFEELCKKFNIPFKYAGWRETDKYSTGGIHKFIVWPQLRQKKYTGVFWEATQEQLDIIADEVPHWDGSIVRNSTSDTYRYFSKHRENADFIQYVFSSQGRTATINKDKREEGDCGFTVNYNAAGGGFRSFANKDGKCEVVTEPTPDGRKYCFETSTGFFLARYNGRIFVTGNSSKSYVGLMRHARFIEDPHYVGYVIRKNASMIMSTGGLFDEAVELYREIEPGIGIKTRDKKIIFPSGAQVAFNHYENDTAGEELYQGLQITNIMYDEATQADEKHIWWLLSRMRSKANYDGSMWLTCNPDPDSFIAKWIDWYLIPEKDENGNKNKHAGRPDPAKNGVVRYMLRRGDDIVWADTKEELIEKYQVPGRAPVRPISFMGLFGTIDDNPPLKEMNPDYKTNLESLRRVERERLLHGNWYARPEASGHFKRQWLEEELEEPAACDIVRTVRAWDLAGELKSETNPDPDYIASVKMSLLRNGRYFIHDVLRFRARFGDWVNKIVEVAKRDGRRVDILIPEDPNASAKAASRMLVNDIISHGFYAKCKPTNRSKLDRYRPFAASAKNGNVSILVGCANDEENNIQNDNNFYYAEQEVFKGNGKDRHDDMVDSTADAFTELAAKQVIPTFSLPMFSKQNEFNRKVIG